MEGNAVAPSEEQPHTIPTASPEIKSGNDSRDSISYQALAWAVAASGLTVFLAVSIPVGLTYGWFAGIVSGVVSTILAGLILIPTRHRWMKALLKMVT